VTVFDRKRERLEAMREIGDNVTALYGWKDRIESAVVNADLVVGAVLIPGARAPHVVSAAQVSRMSEGSVIVDISVDQGGCIETTRPTDYRTPTYRVDDVVHLAVTNLPGAVPRTASQSLSAALSPYLLPLAGGALDELAALRRGINVRAGETCHPALLSSPEEK
jgi:alanine dehydrogenase